MGRVIEVHYCLQRHNYPYVCITLPMHHSLLSAVVMAWHLPQQTYNLSEQQHRMQKYLPRFCVPQASFVAVPKWLGLQVFTKSSSELSQNKYLIVPELTECLNNVCLLNIMVRSNFFWGQRLDNFPRSE